MGWEGPVTNRQFTTWMAYLVADLNKPSRADFYQMQTTAEVRLSRMKKGGRVKISDLIIPFREPGKKSGMTVEQATAIQKAKWFRATGYRSRKDGN